MQFQTKDSSYISKCDLFRIYTSRLNYTIVSIFIRSISNNIPIKVTKITASHELNRK